MTKIIGRQLKDYDVPYVLKTRAPTPADDGYSKPTLWLHTSANRAYLLVDNAAGDATWVALAAGEFLEWQDSVKDKDLTAPPGSPSTGDRYIVGTGATGAWTGHDDEIAEYDGANWDFTSPSEGFACLVDDENVVYVYNGSSWVQIGTFLGTVDIDGGTIDNTSIGQTTPAPITATVLRCDDPTSEDDVGDRSYNDQRHFFRKPAVISGEFSAISGEDQSEVLNLIGLHTNSGELVTKVIAYINNDLGAGNDTNILCRLSFYESDSMTEDELINDFGFNLTYTEVKTATIPAGATTGDVDTTAGLVKHDAVRFLGSGETQQRVTAVIDDDTLEFTAVEHDQIVDADVVRVSEITDAFRLYDADGTNEIHAKLESLAAPGAAMTVAIVIDLD